MVKVLASSYRVLFTEVPSKVANFMAVSLVSDKPIENAIFGNPHYYLVEVIVLSGIVAISDCLCCYFLACSSIC